MHSLVKSIFILKNCLVLVKQMLNTKKNSQNGAYKLSQLIPILRFFYQISIIALDLWIHWNSVYLCMMYIFLERSTAFISFPVELCHQPHLPLPYFFPTKFYSFTDAKSIGIHFILSESSYFEQTLFYFCISFIETLW